MDEVGSTPAKTNGRLEESGWSYEESEGNWTWKLRKSNWKTNNINFKNLKRQLKTKEYKKNNENYWKNIIKTEIIKKEQKTNETKQ